MEIGWRSDLRLDWRSDRSPTMHPTTTVHPTASATMHPRLNAAIDEVIDDEGAGSEAG